jgi:hypothetical protein
VNRNAEDKLLNPRPGSKAAQARDFGIDLTLIVENLRLTPSQRLKNNDQAANDLAKLRAAARKVRKSPLK